MANPLEFGAVTPEFGAVSPEFGAVPPEFGAVSPEFGAVPPEFGAVPPEFGAVPPEFGLVSPEFGAVPRSCVQSTGDVCNKAVVYSAKRLMLSSVNNSPSNSICFMLGLRAFK